jgi:DNA-binding CsgD family transcriptional regulator
VIVGRESELETVGAFLRRETPAVLALIEGEAGIGKTALWSAALDAGGDRVLVARPSAAETASSYAALDDLVRPVIDLLPRVPEVPRRALSAALMLEPATGPLEPRSVGAGLLALLAELAPAAVAIDDLQWLDAATAAVLAFAMRRLPAGVRVLATVRTGEADEAVASLVRQLPEGGTFELSLGPLDGVALREIVERRVGATLSPPAVARLEEAARGNPLTAIELARAERGGPLDATDVRRLLAARVAALSEPAREVVRAAAALAAPTDELVGEVGLEEALVAEVLVRDGDRLRFAHPLLAAAVQERTPAPAWRALHRRLAGLVTDIEQRARHLAEAAEGPDSTTAAELDAAAVRAAERGAPAAAADLAERAGRLTPEGDGEARQRRQLAAADWWVAASDGVPARRLLEGLITQLPPGHSRAQALWRLAHIGTEDGALESSTQLARQALVEAGDDDALLAEINLVFSEYWHVTGIREALTHAERAAVHAERSGDAALRARSLVELAFHRYTLGEGVQRAALVEAAQLESRAGLVTSSGGANSELVFQLALSAHFDEARELLAHEFDAVRRSGNDDLASKLHFAGVVLELRSGRVAAADEHAQRMFMLTVGSGISNYETAARWARGLVDLHLGRVEMALEHLHLALDMARQSKDSPFAINVAHALGLLELSRGNAAAAVAWLKPLPAEEAALDSAEPMSLQLGGDVAEALVLTGDLVGAAEAQASLERHRDRPWAAGTALRCRGLIRGAEGRHEEAIADHRAALDVLAGAGQPLEIARTLLALGTEQRRAKQRRAARESLTAAIAAFGDLSAALWAERARTELARLGGRRAADRDELTETERRIAELAAEGRPNREIAAALFVSERTVESNLTRAYRKLGVRSRTELARRFAEAAGPRG